LIAETSSEDPNAMPDSVSSEERKKWKVDTVCLFASVRMLSIKFNLMYNYDLYKIIQR